MAYLMIVDDDVDFATAAATVLRNSGHEVCIESDPKVAITSMANRRPDLVVLDVMFPEDPAAGFALARSMHHYNQALQNIPVLMLTAVNSKFPVGFSKRDIDELWLPVADFLEKPVDLGVLRDRIALLLRGDSGATPTGR